MTILDVDEFMVLKEETLTGEIFLIPKNNSVFTLIFMMQKAEDQRLYVFCFLYFYIGG